ncbi:MAG: sensor histidine kinase [Chloroflexi bacterium]|nr:sensor histidine kinase [Chloroflexota bacterium]MBP8059792.1 sensor histidine kinase [Chloroflexota bacterium]
MPASATSLILIFIVSFLAVALWRLWLTQSTLRTDHQRLQQQITTLTEERHRQELIYGLMIFLQGVSDPTVVQERLLQMGREELHLSQMAVGLVNPALHRLDQWCSYPAVSELPPLLLATEAGLLAQVAEEQSPCRVLGEKAVANGQFSAWLGRGEWLVLPLVWEGRTMGMMLVGEGNAAADQLTLEHLAQQAAIALNTIERTRQLAIEGERNRIARDIHDTVTQSLFGLSFSLDACTKLLPAQPLIVKDELGELAQLVTQVRSQVRQSILDIWPSTLNRAQFQDDLEKYISQYALARSFNTEFTIEGDFDGLPAVIRRTLYRVCQEALANSARHSGSDLARIYLTIEPTEVHLSIRDKGRGFDAKTTLTRVHDRERFGLKGIQERILALGGTCDILSELGQGTQVLVRIPVKRPR